MIRNADLSKLSDKSLIGEAEYLFEQCRRRVHHLADSIMMIKNGVVLSIPIWKISEDYNLLAERYQMVMEEIQYRKIP